MTATLTTPATATARCLGIFGMRPVEGKLPARDTLSIDGFELGAAIHAKSRVTWDPDAPANARAVLVRVRAFSCNYRDKAFIDLARQYPANRFFAIGSEFCATVEAVGPQVTELAVGDRVFGENSYVTPAPDPQGVMPGIPTNQASTEYMVLPARKLMRVPASMSDVEAACFSLNAQTAYSMCNKVGAGPGKNVLVTAATSGTSLFSIAALRALGATVYAATTSPDKVDALYAMGAHEVILRDRETPFHKDETLARTALAIDGFDAAIDPFFDLHAQVCLGMLKPLGRYVTCGLAAQTEGTGALDKSVQRNADHLLLAAMMKNLVIIGNCLGTVDDLARAAADYTAGRFRPPVDRVYGGTDAAAFLHRTFVDRARLGKVAFAYDVP